MALSGFLIVRILSKSEYAAYTIAASLQALLNALTDSGIGWGLNAVGGRIWNDSARLRGLIAIGLRLRSYLAFVAVPLTVLSAFYLLRKNGVSWPTTIALTAGVLVTIWGTFLTNIYAVPLRLRSLYTTAQKFDLLGASLRFVLLAILASFFLNAISAVLITAMALTVQGILLRRSVDRILVDEPKEEESDRRALIGLMKKQALATIFFAYQGQITIWLISVFGSAEKVADIGALSRLAIIFALVASILTGLVAPTFARCESLDRLLRLFVTALVAYLVFAALLLFCSIAFPSEMLWILGGKYASLTREVPLLVTSSVVVGLTWVVHTLALSRGWVWQTWTVPVATVLVQLACARFVHFDSVAGVLVFSIISLIPGLVITSYMTARGLWTSWRKGSLTPMAA
jgi:O-antigen/teichoic acid export membrane protein